MLWKKTERSALKKEVVDIKSKIASGEQPVFDTVDALFESLEK